jgi:hypothetical protein
MDIRVLDLDGSIRQQPLFLQRFQPLVHDLRRWGPRLRLGCTFRAFRRWEAALARAVASPMDTAPALTFVGSGDFHHVSLSLVRRIGQPFNLLIFDNHPDWMRGIPFLHCGTWVVHAARLPQIRHIFHVGGNVDFDNTFRWLAPWKLLRSGKVHVLPSVRGFEGGGWAKVPHQPLRPEPHTPMDEGRLRRLLQPFEEELARWPLYVSLDKDVMSSQEATVNWDSGHLTLAEVETALTLFTEAAHDKLAGMDVVGDWSPVDLSGIGRRVLHWTEHPSLEVSPLRASHRNQLANVTLAQRWMRFMAPLGDNVTR